MFRIAAGIPPFYLSKSVSRLLRQLLDRRSWRNADTDLRFAVSTPLPLNMSDEDLLVPSSEPSPSTASPFTYQVSLADLMYFAQRWKQPRRHVIKSLHDSSLGDSTLVREMGGWLPTPNEVDQFGKLTSLAHQQSLASTALYATSDLVSPSSIISIGQEMRRSTRWAAVSATSPSSSACRYRRRSTLE